MKISIDTSLYQALPMYKYAVNALLEAGHGTHNTQQAAQTLQDVEAFCSGPKIPDGYRLTDFIDDVLDDETYISVEDVTPRKTKSSCRIFCNTFGIHHVNYPISRLSEIVTKLQGVLSLIPPNKKLFVRLDTENWKVLDRFYIHVCLGGKPLDDGHVWEEVKR